MELREIPGKDLIAELQGEGRVEALSWKTKERSLVRLSNQRGASRDRKGFDP